MHAYCLVYLSIFFVATFQFHHLDAQENLLMLVFFYLSFRVSFPI